MKAIVWLLALPLFIGLVSCKKESDTKPTLTEFISFKANGSSLSIDSCNYEINTGIAPLARVLVLFPGSSQIADRDFLQMSIPSNVSSQTFDLTTSSLGGATFALQRVFYDSNNQNSSLTVTTTENTPQRVSGTFQGKLYSNDGTQSITITEGRFSAKKY